MIHSKKKGKERKRKRIPRRERVLGKKKNMHVVTYLA
jgi:hypothetical protein